MWIILWNEICGREKREKPREKPTQTPFRPPRNPHGGTETRPRDHSGGRRASNRLRHVAAVPKIIEIIVNKRAEKINDSEIVELRRKYKFDRYTFSRLTDNKILEYVRDYLAAFYVNSFRKFEGCMRMSC